MNDYTKMTKADLIALLASLATDTGDTLPIGGDPLATPDDVATAPRKTARKTAPRKTATKTVAKVANPNKFRITKGTPGERYVTAGGAKIKGYTFASWMSGDVKKTAITTGNTLVIARDGITQDQAQAIVDAWVAKAPKARKTATTVEHADAWVITA